VGTIPELFTAVEYAPGKKFVLESGSRLFDPAAKEAVLGSFAADQLKLKVGDTFHPFHGLIYSPKEQHADIYTVRASWSPPILPPTKWSGSRSTGCRR